MEPADAIAALAAMPDALQRRLAGLTDAQLRFKPAGDVFSVLENVCHLRDIEAEGYARRLELLLREPHPTLPDIDGSALARQRSYNSQPLQSALEAFIATRRGCLKTLEDVTPAELGRSGHFENVGEVSLAKLLQLWVGHDHSHIQELDELLPMLRDSGTGGRPKPSLSLSSP
jgi:hypothetical protein